MTAIALAILAKAPIAGRVKTRLAAEIGPEAAARLQHALLVRTLREAAASDLALHLYAEPVEHPIMPKLAADYGAALHPQPTGDLGQRMHGVLSTLLQEYRAALLIGSDCISLDGPILKQAAQWLEAAPAVLGPAEDGGYLLIGLRQACAALFEAIPWSTNAVLPRTRQALHQHCPGFVELPCGWDVDTVDDLERLRRSPQFDLALSTALP